VVVGSLVVAGAKGTMTDDDCEYQKWMMFILTIDYYSTVVDAPSTVTFNTLNSGRVSTRCPLEDKIARFVRETLWTKIKFTSDSNMLYRSGTVYKLLVSRMGVDKNMSNKDWRRYSSVIRRALNGKRNNCSGTMKNAFMSKCVAVCDANCEI
jgi:hypothetical protein